VTPGELSPHRVVVHHDHPRIPGLSFFEKRARNIQLLLLHVTDNRDVAQVPGQRSSRNALGSVDPDEVDALDMQ
jgi:hypothetical protein